jgi:L,D-peptidoglycan transpeptidase YkuD (ErfK/YbiS/YcfS/YnhG family)
VYSGLEVRVISLTIVFIFLFSSALFAQDAKTETERPRNLKLLKEYSDGKGHIIREVQYTQGSMRVTETIIIPKIPGFNQRIAISPDTMNKDSVMVMVDKTKYSVRVYYKRRVVRNYKAVFGPNPKQNKCMEGDRCTPEGWFKITNKNPQSKYNKFMLLSYPNDSAQIRFNKLKHDGLIPKGARIGGDIGIHGIWKGGDDMIELGVGWTDGCVALKNKDVEELFTMVGVGTRVYIKK